MKFENLHIEDDYMMYESETGAIHYFITPVTGGVYADGYALTAEKLVDVTDDNGKIIDVEVEQGKTRYYMSLGDAIKEVERREWELMDD